MKIAENTFVLGAGASMGYGFPSGAGLKDSAIETLSNKNNEEYKIVLKAGKELDYQKEDITAFIKGLKAATRDRSIDEYIESQHKNPNIRKLSQVAKCIIAIQIIKGEQDEALTTDRSWYDSLFDKMYRGNNSFVRFFDNKTSFITFNYDRSLERYLLLETMRVFGEEENECRERLKDAYKVIHVHGSLGDLWESEEYNNEYRPYSNSWQDPKDVAKAAQRIRLITDDIEPAADSQFQEARRLIEEADTVHFIGFGFHQNNMRRLGFLEPDVISKESHKFFGTVKGVSDQDIIMFARNYGLTTSAYLGVNFRLTQSVTNRNTAYNFMEMAPFD